ncbi:hypothetical protein GOP47_0013653 [Adiantum capillus-veneris]|uniref:PPIase cyclophilin-type domain-containing protein n=1 Tax=Adiantum capillus-veneris TaxID=13818 RepID=A0A9D4UPF4_ADICA|nr:hypothetical protein GOP47_0013653 [Adiantum capillus-veneris]
MGAITLKLGLPLAPALPNQNSHHRQRHGQCFFVSAHSCRNEQPNDSCGDDVGRKSSPFSRRRDFLFTLAAGTLSGVLRWNLLGLGLGLGLGLESPSLAEDSSSAADYTITDKVYLEITKCPSISITSRQNGADSQGVVPVAPTYMYTSSSLSSTLTSMASSSSAQATPSTSPASICNDGELLGRIVIGLYGKQVPETVANFKAMCTGKAGSSYKGSLIHRILAGQYIIAGKQGFSREKGEVLPPPKLDRNMESINPDAFKIPHRRPGTVSLCLSENDDEDQFKLDPDYRNVEFLITTGPGPAPQLDNKNIVFGTVLEGLDVVLISASVPTYKPSERIRQFNEFASFLGDERASNARSIWNRPLKALYISDCGELSK